MGEIRQEDELEPGVERDVALAPMSESVVDRILVHDRHYPVFFVAFTARATRALVAGMSTPS